MQAAAQGAGSDAERKDTPGKSSSKTVTDTVVGAWRGGRGREGSGRGGERRRVAPRGGGGAPHAPRGSWALERERERELPRQRLPLHTRTFPLGMPQQQQHNNIDKRAATPHLKKTNRKPLKQQHKKLLMNLMMISRFNKWLFL